MSDVYLWVKALHVISVIAFMAGMLYLPRLFVYHAGAPKKSAQSETFKIMERRLERAIMLPALIVMLGTGIFLASKADFFGATWFDLKMLCVVALIGVYLYLTRQRRLFAADANQHSAKFFRVLNEVPTLLMIAIVIFVIVKPFV